LESDWGDDPLDSAERPYVTEGRGGVLPTLAAVWAMRAEPPGFRTIDYRQLLDVGQEVVIHRPLPRDARIRVQAAIVSVRDRGLGRGVILTTEMAITNELNGDLLATARASALARADGGFGGPSELPSPPHSMPDRPADTVLSVSTRPNQALLYRLSGDLNPLHSDPVAADAAGFEHPTLHGLCTYAVTARAVSKAYGQQIPQRIASHSARFSAPVYPSDEIRIRLWRDANVVSFCADLPDRSVEVIKNGYSILRD
jgi:acyl dehydratase